MPYSITTKDGITINGVPDDMPADHPDLKAKVAEIRARAAPATPASPASPAATPDDPGIMGTISIAAGRTTDRVLDGITQAYLKARGEEQALGGLKQNVDEKTALYQPLQQQHPVATAVGESIPSMVVPVGGAATALGTAGRLALAGGLPGALEYGSAEERAKRGAGGAAAGVIGGAVAPIAGRAVLSGAQAVGRGAKAVVEPLYAAGREAIAGRALTSAAGDAAPAVAARLDTAAPLVAGSEPTAAQVAESGGIAALERSVAAKQPESFTKRAMDQASARMQALRGIAGDDATMAASQAVRKTVTKPLYAAAKAQTVTTMDPQLQELLNRPSVQKAIVRARTLAQEDGRVFGLDPGAPASPGPHILDADGAPLLDLGTKEVPGKISGQTLQDIKMGLDSLLKDPTSGIAGAEANSVKATRGQLMNWMEQAIPELGVARKTYSDLSRPINQQQIGQALVEKLEPALSEHGALGRETANKYALALRNADQTARTATGFKGAGMADVMEPAQMDTLSAIAKDLARRANAQDLGRGPGSNTFQNLAMDNIANQSGVPRAVGGVLNLPVINKMARMAYSGPEEEIQSLIAQALLKPKQAAALMSRAKPASPGLPILRKPGPAAAIGGGTAGVALGDLFAQ